MIRQTSQIRFAALDANHEIPFYYDDLVADWISCSEYMVQCGNNSSAATGFMQVDNFGGAAAMSATYGFYLPYDGRLRWMTFANRDDLPATSMEVEVFNNGSSVLQTSWLNNNRKTLDVVLVPGNLSLRLNTLLPSSVGPGYPNLHLGVRWRMP